MKHLLSLLICLIVSISLSAQEKYSALYKIINTDAKEVYASNILIPATDIESVDIVKDVDADIKNQGYNLLIVARLKKAINLITLGEYFCKKGINAEKITVNGKEENESYPSLTKGDMDVKYKVEGDVINVYVDVPESKGLRIK